MKSHGDGARMTLAEALERRARIARVWGCVSRWPGETVYHQDRRWAAYGCLCGASASAVDDVAMLDGAPVAMCRNCRTLRQAAAQARRIVWDRETT